MKNYDQTIFISKTSWKGKTTSHRTSTNAITLPDLLEAFENHLKGAGFCFDGRLDFVDEYGEPVKKEFDGSEFNKYFGQ